MRTVFDKPQFTLLPDKIGVRMYGNVSNLLEVVQGERIHHVALAVPTGLFVLMQDVLKIPPEDSVTLSIDQVGERHVFSLLHGTSLIDLWTFSASSIPAWIQGTEYIVSPNTPALI